MPMAYYRYMKTYTPALFENLFFTQTRVLATAALCALCVIGTSVMTSGNASAEIRLKQVATGFTAPVDIVNAGDARLFVVEQGGLIKITAPGVATPSTFLDVSALLATGGERGLLGLAFDPNYAASTNRRFYVYYTRSSDGAIVIARYQTSATNANVADSSTATTLLVIPHSANTNHNGGGLRFGSDGYLYIAVGDGGGGGDPQCNAQNPAVLLGKLLRIDVSSQATYAIPANNPVLSTTGARGEIFALGLRNPWRISFDKFNGDLYIGDVGQNLYEEVNYVQGSATINPPSAPLNFGWPQREGLQPYTTPCTDSNLVRTEPILDYVHAASNLSITGGYRYRGTRVPELMSDVQYTYADFVSRRIWSATRNAAGAWASRLLIDAPASVSTFGQDNTGELYITGYNNGIIYRITSTLGPSLDVDLNGSFDASTDGVLLMRYLLGFRGNSLITGALGANPLRASANDIEIYLAANLAAFNVGGNVGVSAAREGVVILRYLLNLPDNALTPGTGVTQNPAQIRALLDALKP